MKKIITKNILLLALISFFTDIASEILFPIMPLYLSSIGIGIIALGVIEGVAEGIAGLSKAYFGYLSDKTHRRRVFIQIGYALSAFTKPLFVFFTTVIPVTILRSADRIGKGLRTAPRDAILTEESSPENRGKIFGFHRGMDTLGATLGPVVALIFLYFSPGNYKQIFLWALVPGILAVFCTFFLRKDKKQIVPDQKPGLLNKEILEKSKVSYRQFWRETTSSYKTIMIGLLFIAFINTSDMFLILRAQELGVSDMNTIIAYIIYNLIFTLAAIPTGYFADKFGFKKIYITGIFVFVATYTTLSYTISSSTLLGIFAFYGIFAAISQGVGVAWLSLHLPKKYEATALGTFLMFQSFAILFGNIIFSVLWSKYGSEVAFIGVGTLGLCAALYFFFIKSSKNDDGNKQQRGLQDLGCIGQH